MKILGSPYCRHALLSLTNPVRFQVLDEFYETMKAVGVSASTGMGMDELFAAIDDCKQEYYDLYHKELEQRAQV